MFKALGYHTFAKILVVLAAYALHFGLGRMLTVEEYGIVGTLVTFCNFYYMFLTNGVRQGISKQLAVDKYNNKVVINTGITIQIIFSLILSLINIFIAPILAKAFGSAEYTDYIRLISILIPLTAVYFAFTGGLNGSKLFLKEAIVISLYPLLRLTALPLLNLVPDNKPTGVIMGFCLASFVAAVIAGTFLLTDKKTRAVKSDAEKLTYKTMIKASVEFIVFFAAITIILNLDTFYLQYVRKSNKLTGFYTGVHTFSLVPYYLISAFYLVILPFVAENYAKGDIDRVKKVISKNFNLIAMFILPVVVLISVTAPQLLSCFYKPEYYKAGNALRILCFGTFFLSVFAVLNVVLNGMNCRKLTRILSIITVIIDVILLNVLIPKFGITGAAIATSISGITGFLVSLVYLLKKIGNPFDLKTIFKSVALCVIFAGLCFGLFKFIEVNNLIILMLIYSAFAVLYFGCMILFKIINIKELIKKKAGK